MRKKPTRMTLFTKPGCPHWRQSQEAIKVERGFNYEEIELGSHGISYSSLVAVSGSALHHKSILMVSILVVQKTWKPGWPNA